MKRGPFGEWSIEKVVYDWIISNLPKGSTILEFGSGMASEELSKDYKLYSIEDCEYYLNKYNTNYIYAPIVEPLKWYDPVVLEKSLKGLKYDMLLIDGPEHAFRGNMFKCAHMFDWSVPVVVDDTQERDVAEQAARIASELCKRPMVILEGDEKMTAVIK